MRIFNQNWCIKTVSEVGRTICIFYGSNPYMFSKNITDTNHFAYWASHWNIYFLFFIILQVNFRIKAIWCFIIWLKIRVLYATKRWGILSKLPLVLMISAEYQWFPHLALTEFLLSLFVSAMGTTFISCESFHNISAANIFSSYNLWPSWQR